jgi:hypothetical protein
VSSRTVHFIPFFLSFTSLFRVIFIHVCRLLHDQNTLTTTLDSGHILSGSGWVGLIGDNYLPRMPPPPDRTWPSPDIMCGDRQQWTYFRLPLTTLSPSSLSNAPFTSGSFVFISPPSCLPSFSPCFTPPATALHSLLAKNGGVGEEKHQMPFVRCALLLIFEQTREPFPLLRMFGQKDGMAKGREGVPRWRISTQQEVMASFVTTSKN